MKRLTLLLIVALMVLPSCKGPDIENLARAVIVSFETSATVTAVYAPVTLTWEVRDADMVILTDVGLVPSIGSRQVNPQETTTYTLIAEGIDNTKTSKSLTVKVDRASACQGLRIPEYSFNSGSMYVKVGPNLSAFYAARNVTIQWTLYDGNGRIERIYYGIIAKIMPGMYGEITIRAKNVSYVSSNLKIIHCECPLVKP